MHLLHEALSRVRMRVPQAGGTTTSTEATRSAREIAMRARRRWARELGGEATSSAVERNAALLAR